MGKVTNLKKTVEASMADNGANPIAMVKKKAESMFKAEKMSEEEKKKIMELAKDMDMDEEADMEEFKEELAKVQNFGEFKSVVEKYMK